MNRPSRSSNVWLVPLTTIGCGSVTYFWVFASSWKKKKFWNRCVVMAQLARISVYSWMNNIPQHIWQLFFVQNTVFWGSDAVYPGTNFLTYLKDSPTSRFHSSALKMKTLHFSQTLIHFYRTVQCHIAEGNCYLLSSAWEFLNSQTLTWVFVSSRNGIIGNYWIKL